MTIDAVVYISSVANPRKHSRKIECLETFAAGVKNSGGNVVVEWDHKYTPSRLAVMLGWATTNTGGPNIALRKQIIAEQQRQGLKTMCIDASCWKYLDDQGTYLRYSIGGPFYDRAEYANHNSDDTRWMEISTRLNIKLNDAPVDRPDGHILICMQRDGGFAMKTLDHTRITIAAQALGIAQGAFDVAKKYAHERQQFGKPIFDFQAVQFMLADMAMQIEAARQLTYAAAVKSERGESDLTFFSAASKCFATDVAMKVTTDAVQVLGGYGYVSDYPVERMMRDAKLTQIYEGTNQIQRVVMARNLDTLTN